MTVIDLSLLPAPNVVEPLDFEAVLAQIKTEILQRVPADMLDAVRAVLDLESEPLTILAEAAAYRETLIRARVNDAAKAVMLAYAHGNDLDQLGANYDVTRLQGEDDTRLRGRIQQGFHRLAAAGPANAYRQHALAVSTDIRDVEVWSEAPGRVNVSVLGREVKPSADLTGADLATSTALFGAGPDASHAYAIAPTDSALLRAVLSALNADDVRPLTDHVVVRAPTTRTYSVRAVIEILPGPDPDLILSRRRAALQAYAASVSRLGYDATRANLIAALVEPGVKNAHLIEPADDVVCGHGEIPVFMGASITAEAADV